MQLSKCVNAGEHTNPLIDADNPLYAMSPLTRLLNGGGEEPSVKLIKTLTYKGK